MWFLTFALRRPITILVAVLAVILTSIMAIRKMKMDILPVLGTPVIYVAQPYGGLDPLQMEGFISSYYEYHFLYETGIKSVESRSIEGVSLLKLEFFPDTNMAQAVAETVAYVERSKAFMPPGTVGPFIVRFDAGSVPVGDLVFSSETRSLGEIQDLALYKVRPMFASLEGVSAPPPIGGNQRTIVFHADANKLRNYQISPDQVVQALATGNTIAPSGVLRIDNTTYLTPNNAVVPSIKTMEDIPILNERGATIFMRDIGWVEDSSDILTGYALVDGRRAVYIPVTKRPDASTWSIVQTVKKALPSFQAAVPADIKVTYEFDQSGYVKNALLGLLLEGALGTLLTGLMIYLFIRDLKSAAIVVVTIPIAILAATCGLWFSGQTINIMTLGGLALAVGILVDESTVTIENIHTKYAQDYAQGKHIANAVLDSGREILLVRFLILVCILTVFVPTFFMSGIPHALFVPLALAVSFAMIASYLLAQAFVPILVIKILKNSKPPELSKRFIAFKKKYESFLKRLFSAQKIIIIGYLVVCGISIFLIWKIIGMEVFPSVNGGQFQMRIDAPVGTRVETTEIFVHQVLDTIAEVAGKDNIEKTLVFLGNQPPSYPINTIYLWTSGPHEAVITVALKNKSTNISALKEKLRTKIAQELKDVSITFEPGDLVNQVINSGAISPIEIAITGKSMEDNKFYAAKLKNELAKIKEIRDLRYGEVHDYPALSIDIDRVRAGQLGVTTAQVYNALIPATFSSRFTTPNYWLETETGNAYQVQVEIPQFQIQTIEDIFGVPAIQNTGELAPNVGQALEAIRDIPAIQNSNRAEGPFVRDLANVSQKNVWGEPHRLNNQRIYSLTANIQGNDLRKAASDVQKAIQRAGEKPRGLGVEVRSQIKLLFETLSDLRVALFMAIVATFLVLAANFQSFSLALISLSTIPAVLVGAGLVLLLTGGTLNIQSYLGIIMAIGISVANAILLVTVAEELRKTNKDATASAIEGGLKRIRPILMTAIAMVAGMFPMALSIGFGGDQTSPLGRALIGGLSASTFTTLLILPLIFASMRKKSTVASESLDPEDPSSIHYENKKEA